MAANTIKLDTREWNRVMPIYLQHTKRDLATVMNTKGYIIARFALYWTPKVDRSRIRSIWRGGRATHRQGAHLGRIVNAARGRLGYKGLWGKKMSDEISVVGARRLRSVGFLASGWLPAIKKLASHKKGGGRLPSMRGAQQFGRAKGDARVAVPAWKVLCVIENHVGEKDNHAIALARFGAPALQQAFDQEVASMKTYIERKMAASAKTLGIKTG